MPKGTVSIDVDSPCEEVFNVIHDYSRRLEWDTMLSEARLLAGAACAGLGVRSCCVGTWRSARFALETEYIRFEPGRVAAVTLTNRPPFFERFAATIRHDPLKDNRSTVTYVFSFHARPRLLAPLIEPIMHAMIKRETSRRLLSLRTYVERLGNERPVSPPIAPG